MNIEKFVQTALALQELVKEGATTVDGKLFASLERLIPSERDALVGYMLKHGGQFDTDANSYEEMGYKDTFHLWLENDAVRLFCGYQFLGKAPENCAFQI